MTAGELADAAHLTTGAVTTVLDRLEDVGYVRRIRDTDDRRRVLVEQTPECTRTAMRYYGPFMEPSFESMAKYTPEELERSATSCAAVAVLVRGYAEELPLTEAG